jgi:hypothetical protein
MVHVHVHVHVLVHAPLEELVAADPRPEALADARASALAKLGQSVR